MLYAGDKITLALMLYSLARVKNPRKLKTQINV